MSTELTYLTLTALLTASLWIPYILMLISQMGLVPALMDRQHEFTLEPAWARRSQRAHTNAVENLVVFGALVLVLEQTGGASSITATAATIYFFSRVAHAAIYIAGVPVIRTLVFAVGFFCQIVIGLAVFGIV